MRTRGVSKSLTYSARVIAQVQEEWIARYNHLGNGPDQATALTKDSNGNVYVTGFSYSYDNRFDFITIKYDANGNQVWVARYNGPSNNYDKGKGIAVDASGNVYVTGDSCKPHSIYGWDMFCDYLTIKYDVNGNQIWERRYGNLIDNSNEKVSDIALDASGNAYVTGGAGTIKYDTNGNELWKVDGGSALTIDSNGDIYLTAGNGMIAVKYDTDGNQIWAAQYSEYPDNFASGNDIAVDTSGNVYVTGKSYSLPVTTIYSYDYITIKYDANGNQLWLAHYNGSGNSSDSANAIATDASGNVYVTGLSYWSDNSIDYATIKYDANGNQLWLVHYNGSSNFGYSTNTIATDASGNVYITGYNCWDSFNNKLICDKPTIKYDTSGNELWKDIETSESYGFLEEISNKILSLDTYGNVYITGMSYTPETKSNDFFTKKYNADGSQLWVAKFSGKSNGSDYANSIFVDESGNIYVSGVSAASGESPEVITLKYDSKGNQLWETSYFVGRDGYGGYLLRVDAQHNVYITCLVYSKESLDWIVIKYDSNGNQLWANRYNSPTNLHDIPMDLELDRDGNVYVTGHSDNEGNSNCITIKYDSDGSQLWSASRSYDFGYCIAISVDDSGNSYVTSNIGDGYANFGTIKYDPNGNQLWTVSYKNDYCYGDSYAKDNTLDNLGNLYVIGNSCNDYTTIKP